VGNRPNWREVMMRLVGRYRDMIVHDMDPRGRVVTKVNAIVEAHEKSDGISGNNCKYLPHTVEYKMSVTISPQSQLFRPTSAGVRGKVGRENARKHEIHVVL
jgi:hypothetical protein